MINPPHSFPGPASERDGEGEKENHSIPFSTLLFYTVLPFLLFGELRSATCTSPHGHPSFSLSLPDRIRSARLELGVELHGDYLVAHLVATGNQITFFGQLLESISLFFFSIFSSLLLRWPLH